MMDRRIETKIPSDLLYRRLFRHCRRTSVKCSQVCCDFVDNGVAGHLDSEIRRRCKAESIGGAMAFDDDAVEPQEHTAIMTPRIHLGAQRFEGASRQQCPEPR